jgi:hypothetical protein
MSVLYCQAEEYAGRMVCGRCNQAWTADSNERPHCKDKADPPITLGEMIRVSLNEARRIVDSQRACVNAEFRKEPYMPELRNAAVLVAVADTLGRVRRDERIMKLLQGGK